MMISRRVRLPSRPRHSTCSLHSADRVAGIRTRAQRCDCTAPAFSQKLTDNFVVRLSLPRSFPANARKNNSSAAATAPSSGHFPPLLCPHSSVAVVQASPLLFSLLCARRAPAAAAASVAGLLLVRCAVHSAACSRRVRSSNATLLCAREPAPRCPVCFANDDGAR